MDIVFVLLGWCRYHNGASVPLKCCPDNGLASHTFREGASSFTETLSWPQTLFPLAALIPCPAKLSSRDATAVSFDAFHSGIRNCIESTWGQSPPAFLTPSLSSHTDTVRGFISEVLWCSSMETSWQFAAALESHKRSWKLDGNQEIFCQVPCPCYCLRQCESLASPC